MSWGANADVMDPMNRSKRSRSRFKYSSRRTTCHREDDDSVGGNRARDIKKCFDTDELWLCHVASQLQQGL